MSAQGSIFFVLGPSVFGEWGDLCVAFLMLCLSTALFGARVHSERLFLTCPDGQKGGEHMAQAPREVPAESWAMKAHGQQLTAVGPALLWQVRDSGLSTSPTPTC